MHIPPLCLQAFGFLSCYVQGLLRAAASGIAELDQPLDTQLAAALPPWTLAGSGGIARPSGIATTRQVPQLREAMHGAGSRAAQPVAAPHRASSGYQQHATPRVVALPPAPVLPQSPFAAAAGLPAGHVEPPSPHPLGLEVPLQPAGGAGLPGCG